MNRPKLIKVASECGGGKKELSGGDGNIQYLSSGSYSGYKHLSKFIKLYAKSTHYNICKFIYRHTYIQREEASNHVYMRR